MRLDELDEDIRKKPYYKKVDMEEIENIFFDGVKEPIGIIEYNPDTGIDTAYTEDDLMINIIRRPYPDPQLHPECFDWKCQLKDRTAEKNIGDPIYSDEVEYFYPLLKEDWRDFI